MLPDDAKIISVDDHVIEHPRVWLDRLPAKYADVAPRIVKLPDGRVVQAGAVKNHRQRVAVVRTIGEDIELQEGALLHGEVVGAWWIHRGAIVAEAPARGTAVAARELHGPPQ